MKTVSLIVALVLVAFLITSCSDSCRIHKAVQDLNRSEKAALNSLLIKIYKETFDVTLMGEKPPSSGSYRPAMLLGVKIFILPSSGERLDRPIESLSLTSGFIWDSEDEVKSKISRNIDKYEVVVNPNSKHLKTLMISDYELDYKMATPGIGSSPAIITVIPIRIGMK